MALSFIFEDSLKLSLPALSNPAVTSESRADISDARIDSATLFKRHANFVVSFLHRQGVRGADLDDLVQEVFLSAHRKGGYRPGPASPTTFLAQLALQENLKRRRRSLRARLSDAASALALSGRPPTGPADSLSLKQAHDLLSESLERMDSGQRAVFILFELEQESCASIAAGLEIPVGTVHSRLHTARQTFRQVLARLERANAHQAQIMNKGKQP